MFAKHNNILEDKAGQVAAILNTIRGAADQPKSGQKNAIRVSTNCTASDFLTSGSALPKRSVPTPSWRWVLDAKGKLTDSGSMIEAKLRPYRSYLRFQRNSYIKALKAVGMNPQQIRKALEKQMSERLGITRITHISKAE